VQFTVEAGTAITLTVSITMSKEKPYSAVLAKHRTAP